METYYKNYKGRRTPYPYFFSLFFFSSSMNFFSSSLCLFLITYIKLSKLKKRTMTMTHATQLYLSVKHAQFANHIRKTEPKIFATNDRNEIRINKCHKKVPMTENKRTNRAITQSST